MGNQQDIITLLTGNLNGSILLLGDIEAKFTVVPWETPLQLLKKNLLKPNNNFDIVFSVKRSTGAFSRFIQYVAHTYLAKFEVDVWLTESYPYSNSVDYNTLREVAVAEVQRIFTANPAVGSLSETREDDHMLGTVKIYNSTVTVTKKTSV